MTEPPFKMPRVALYAPDWGQQLVDQLNEYMAWLNNAVDNEVEDKIETLTGEPFCGCGDCHEREYLYMATCLVLEGAAAGKVNLEPDP